MYPYLQIASVIRATVLRGKYVPRLLIKWRKRIWKNLNI